MKKIAAVFLLGLALGGCAQLQRVERAYQLATTTVANPVSKDGLYRIEAGVQLVFTGLNTYKKACVQGLADSRCRTTIATIQVYTRQVPPYLRQLRSFVKNNDQVNAAVVYTQLTGLLASIRAEAAARGVEMGG